MPGQGLGGEVERLHSGENRLDDLGREEGQRHEAAHIAFTAIFGFRDLCEGLLAATHDILEPPLGANHGLDQRWVWPGRYAVVCTFEDKTRLDSAALDARWDEVANQRLLTRKLGEVQSDGNLVSTQLNALDQV
jgi:hypothetical protein